jgi:hypothetical protein
MKAPVAIALAALSLVAAAKRAHAEEPKSSVRVNAPSGMRLELSLDSVHLDAWDTICTAPCDVAAPTDGAYRVAGAGYRPSALFALRTHAGESETLRVRPASKARYVIGWVALGAGSAGVAVPLGIVFSYPFLALAGLTPTFSKTEITGLVIAGGAGLVVGGTGLALVLGNRSTTVEQEVDRPPVPQVTAIQVPIFSGRF